LCNRVSLNEVV